MSLIYAEKSRQNLKRSVLYSSFGASFHEFLVNSFSPVEMLLQEYGQQQEKVVLSWMPENVYVGRQIWGFEVCPFICIEYPVSRR